MVMHTSQTGDVPVIQVSVPGGGPLVVDLVLTPQALTTPPVLDAASAGPGLLVVPAPGAGRVLQVLYATTIASAGVAWSGHAGLSVMYGRPAPGAGLTLADRLSDAQAPAGGLTFVSSTTDFGAPAWPAAAVNAPLVLWAVNALTGGTRALSIRLFYVILVVP